MEDAIRNIIQNMIREPQIKAVIEEELDKLQRIGNITPNLLLINKDSEILLPDHGNTKIDIKGFQAKTLYIFYLLAPTGISNKELAAYKDILKEIYKEVCDHRLSDEYRAESMINGLLYRSGALSEATNKIATALRQTPIAEPLFDYYMIKGKRNRNRQINLPKQLIRVENETLIQISKRINKII